MSTILWIVIIVVSLVLSLSILMQNKGAGLSLTFGGSGSYYSSQRGIQKFLHWTTIVTAVVLFILVLLFNFIVPSTAPSTRSPHSTTPMETPDLDVDVGAVQGTDSEGNPVDIEVEPIPVESDK